MTQVMILDTETTGLKNPEIIELAYNYFEGGLLDFADNVELENCFKYHSYFRPKGPIEIGAVVVHGILPSRVKDAPSIDKLVMPEVEYVVGHNIDFDMKMLPQCDNVKRICTLAISRLLFPELDSHNQSSMLYHMLGLNESTLAMLSNAHTAAADVDNCACLLASIVHLTEAETWEELYLFSKQAQVNSRIPFGKHKGDKIKDLPRSYMQWFLKQPEPTPWIETAMRACL